MGQDNMQGDSCGTDMKNSTQKKRPQPGSNESSSDRDSMNRKNIQPQE
jgi:hypothetical protein